MSKETSETIEVHAGRIIHVEETHLPDGRVLEKASRPPGTRVIIFNKETNELLLSCENRIDIGQDFRLPGGKVRDSWNEWAVVKDSPELNQVIIDAAAKEAREEVGYDVSDLQIFNVQTSGGPTIKWDMYYLVSTNFSDRGHQELELGEEIKFAWYPVKEVIEACLTGKIREGRSVAAIMQYLHSVGEI